ncbi:unnamed protein product [Malus baccata var. baccata]
MAFSLLHLLLSLIISLSSLSNFSASSSSSSPENNNQNDGGKTFIVQVQPDSKPSIFPTHHDWYSSSLSSLSSSSSSSQPPTILHTYSTVFHGFSAKLSPSQADQLQSLSHVISLIPEQVRISPPAGTTVTVEPERLAFRRVGQKLNFLVRVHALAVKLSPGSTSVTSGSIVWSDGKHTVTSPLVVTMQQPL